ncbi:hypothetical protein OG785_04510 [Streptomyces sp. NBC_00006]|uniref:hypothetical protein n=1 Tax=Streptomyces sp. NBC_00006 TaxID=2975619 RepID=UPI00225BDC5D|nr:hypothetical protein [Streptomyces sp. NBC_00006]MCX5529823.1 hypothetical protein [Streptomyces sp. NBC_00006]
MARWGVAVGAAAANARVKAAAKVPSAGSIRAVPPQTWIRLDAAERIRYWWRAGFVTLAFIGMAVAAWLTAAAAARWWCIGGVAVFYSLVLSAMVSQGAGATLLTSEGMELRTLFKCWSVPWGEVTKIEVRYRTGRSGTWRYVRVDRVQGKAITVPGAFTVRWSDRKFDAKFAAIQEYWVRSVGT